MALQFIDHDFSKSTGGTDGDFVPIPVPKVPCLDPLFPSHELDGALE